MVTLALGHFYYLLIFTGYQITTRELLRVPKSQAGGIFGFYSCQGFSLLAFSELLGDAGTRK